MAQILAAPLAAALGGGAFATAAANLIVGLGFSAISRALSRQNAGQTSTLAVQSSRTNGATVPQAIMLGHTVTAGSDIFAPYAHDNRITSLGSGSGSEGGSEASASSSGSGQYLTMGIALSDVPVQSLEAMIMQGLRFEMGTDLVDNGSPYGFEVANGRGDEKDQYRGKMWGRFHDGTQTEADPFLLAAYGGHETRPFTSDMIYHGGAYAVLTVQHDNELWQDLTSTLWEVKGAQVGPGGAYTDNAIHLANAIVSGIAMPDGEIYGLQYPDVDPSALASAVAAVDAAGFSAGLEVAIGTPDGQGADALDAIGHLLDACAGSLVEDGGQLFFGALSDGLPVAHITDDDLLLDPEARSKSVTTLSELHNAVTITHPNPDAAWEFIAAPEFSDAAAEAEDGGPLSQPLTFPAVNNSDQAQTLAEMLVRDARRRRVHTIPLPLKWAYLRTMEKLTWSSEFHSYDGKEFVIDEMRQSGHIVYLTIRETDPADFDPGTIAFQPFTPTSPVPVVPAPLVVDLAAAAFERVFDDNRRRPVIRATWSYVPASASAVLIQVRVEGQTETESITADVATLGVEWEAVGGVAYQTRAKYLSETRRTAWSDWISVTSSDVRTGLGDLAPEVWVAISDDALDVAEIALAEFEAGTIAPIQLQVQNLALGTIVQDQALDRLSQDLLFALARVHETQSMVRDAGVYSDPEDGTVRIAGLDQAEGRLSEVEISLNAQIAAIELRATVSQVETLIAEAQLDPTDFTSFQGAMVRLSEAEVKIEGLEAQVELRATVSALEGVDLRLQTAEADIDALNLSLALKVGQVEFEAVETRIQDAEVELQALDGPSIRQSVRDSYALSEQLDLSAVGSLVDLIEQFRQRQALRAAIAFVDQDLRALVDEDREAIAQLSQSLGAAIEANAAGLTTEAKARADAIAALSQTITTLTGTVGSNTSAIQDEATARADAIAALSQAITTLTSTVGSNTSAIQDEATARADAIAALSQTITILTGTVGSNTSAIQDEVTARTNAISALSQTITNLASSVGNNAAAIQDEATARADADGALSQTLNQVSATVGNHTAAISAQATAIDGLGAEYVLQLNNNNHVGGLVLRSEMGQSGATTLDAAFITDTFKIVGVGDNPVVPFAVYSAPRTVNGVQVPAGVYIENAKVAELSALAASFGTFSATAPSGATSSFKGDSWVMSHPNGQPAIVLALE